MVKIVICGAGIAGLSTYLLLQKHLNEASSSSLSPSHEIKIYEAYDIDKHGFKGANLTTTKGRSKTSPAISQDLSVDQPVPTSQTIGGAIGISKNGLNVLSRMESSFPQKSPPTHHDDDSGEANRTGLNCGLVKEVARRGHPIERWEISTARGWTIVDVNLIPRHLRDSDTTSNGDKRNASKRVQSPNAKKAPYMYHSVMIARRACWEILRDRVLALAPDAVVKKKVVEVSIGDSTNPSTLKFEDGTEDSADLIIGADGLRSIVRKAMFESDNGKGGEAARANVRHNGQQNGSWIQAALQWLGLSSRSHAKAKSEGCDYITPHYEGLVGVGGFVPSSILESTGHKPGTMSIVFGPNGFFGYGYLTSSTTPDLSSPAPEFDPHDSTTEAVNRISDEDIKTNGTPRPSSVPATSKPGAVAGWWSTFSSSTPYPYAVAAAGTGATTSTTTNVDDDHATAPLSVETNPNKPTSFNKPLAVSALTSRHKKWKNPSITAIVNYVEVSSSSPPTTSTSSQTPPPAMALDASYPTWTTPELPRWTVRGRAVLVGDAAHALQPSSGQGACQALEDAEALALFLRHYLGASTAADSTAATATATAVATAVEQYERLRKPRVHAIYARSQQMSRMKGDMGVILEWAMYAMIYLMTWFRDDYNDVLFEYDLPSEVEKATQAAEKGA
ncbi:uncharacterized protein A1O9_03825 [Exophiala aquamarina CBS 119918]|uniref:FAD-binding domain-containing protein n=1 Tax=Exophiala aquamarina CBS 119918 TaxID=1182545 RepID=A0A072PGU5_9EURO|nr:uncharacterized protein A1O9_03825 [Exophiala aquamarina CBS 119918]KEF58982.1 hypothetical protein A1O9_03825 [Exophiala aquamarina CBS 119918]